MHKYFVPYNIAKELKEIGFDEPCIDFYDKNGKFLDGGTTYNKSRRLKNGRDYTNLPDSKFIQYGRYISCQVDDDKEPLTPAPLYDQVIDWFIEKYGQVIIIDQTIGSKKWRYCMWNDNNWKGDWLDTPDSKWSYKTRKDALNAGILKAIELIKQTRYGKIRR